MMHKKDISENFMAKKYWILILIICFSGFNIFQYLKNKNKEILWTNEHKEILISKCIDETKNLSLNNISIVKTYCKCSTERIMDSISYKTYIELIKKPKKEQIIEVLPLVKECYSDFESKISK